MNTIPATSRWRAFANLLILLGATIYGSGCASWQRHQIFVPPHFTPQQVDQRAHAVRLERWFDAQGHAIGMKRMSAKQPAAGRLLILYGNSNWTISCVAYANDFQKAAPFDVYILEYPGYADRPDIPTEASVFKAADEAFELLGTNQPVYLLGQSLGSGVAAHLAGTYGRQVAGLILLSPYNRLTGVAQYQVPWLPAWLILVDRFPSEVYLRQYHGPLGVVVDGRDEIVPEKFGLRLYDGYAGPKHLWRFPESGHIEIAEPSAQFCRELLDFWRVNQPNW